MFIICMMKISPVFLICIKTPMVFINVFWLSGITYLIYTNTHIREKKAVCYITDGEDSKGK